MIANIQINKRKAKEKKFFFMTKDLLPFQPKNDKMAINNVSCRITVYDFVVRWTEIITR